VLDQISPKSMMLLGVTDFHMHGGGAVLMT
jgi:hypothetical protein